MEEYQIINPSPQLAPYVKHYWMLRIVSGTSERIRTVPTGHICLIFHRGDRILSDGVLQPRAFLSGHENTYSELEYSGMTDMICVVFKPIGARAFFNLPMSEINDRLVDVYDLEDVVLTDLEKSLADARTDRECVSLIERFLFKRINNLAEHNLKRINEAVKIINAGQANVNSLADAACLSYKQFSRVFSEYIGAKPKEFLRIVRFQRALFLLQTIPEITLMQLAFDSGYYDQSHLIKEFKAFSGYTPTEYLSLCAPYSDYFS